MEGAKSRPRWRNLVRLAAARGGVWPDPRDEVSWRALLSRAESAGLAPGLAWGLAVSAPPRPDWVDERLGRSRLEARARFEIQAVATGGALDALASEGIVPIAVKGADLARRVYPRPELRPMIDVDLVVEPEELERAEAALAGIGFVPVRERSGRLAAGEVEVARAGVKLELRSGFAQYPRWADAFPLDATAMRARAVPLAIEGRSARRLEDADHLLYLIYHLGVVHLFRGPLWVLDLDRLLEASSPFDWRAFLDRARAWGLEPAAWIALGLARRLAGTILPPEVLARLGRRARWAVWFERLETGGVAGAELGRFLLCPDPVRGFLAIGRAVFPPREWLEYRWGSGAAGSYPRAWLGHVRRSIRAASRARSGSRPPGSPGTRGA